ncbi:MBL fold metallo-hydrolase [Rufibacter roseus]|uniref:MBL fold metallo-hydrolase n=1 Tax=Rufibacter roseus TaxID=1567108 RepID=A0ABW2DJZ3_9BACT|nr:MBL fold metallo-hydrolase [Rufibacter roseus]
MDVFITSLNSGSNGNCYYVGNEWEAVLIDVGISCRETEKRMQRLGLSMGRVKAIFVSHEHSDHIRGVEVLAKRYQLPVFISQGTLQNSRLKLPLHLIMPLQADVPVQIGSLSVTAFPKFHDAADPHSFVVSCNSINVGVFTDIGVPCERLMYHFGQCHAAILEANYDEEMLANGHYPYYLKNRIRGGKGHLSNTQALDVFLNHRPPFMSHLLLAHLSKENNNAQMVQELFQAHAQGTEVVVASRYEETPVYQINLTEELV